MASSHKCYLCWFLIFAIVGVGLHLTGFILPGWLNMRRSELDISVGIREMVITEKLRATGFLMIDHGGKLPLLNDGRMPPKEADEHRQWGEKDMTKEEMEKMRREKEQMMREKGEHHESHESHEREMTREQMMEKRRREEQMMRERINGKEMTKEEMMEMRQKEQEMMEKQRSSGTEVKEFVENIEVIELLEQVTAEVTRVDVSMRYGLWFSKICVHQSRPDEEEMEEAGEMVGKAEMHDDSSSSSSDESHHGRRHHRKNCHCKKISTESALKHSFLFLRSYHQKNNIGHASLKEHQAEATVGLVLMILGLIAGIMCLRKPDGCRCIKVVTMVIMTVAIVLVAVPAGRLAHYSHYRRHLHDDVTVGCPISAYLSGTGCVMILFSALVTLFSYCSSRKESPGRWYQFNNELQVEEKPEKGPALVFYEPYPVKAGLVDAVDFSHLKPEETFEPEKKPLE